MTTKYPGGLIRKTPPTITPPVDGEGGSAPGVWTLEQASYYTKQGTWPKPVVQRELWAWGYNYFGQLGDNTNITKSSPVQVGSETYWSKTACGTYAAFGIKNDGTLWSWGYNTLGQLGQNISETATRSSPIQVGALTNWSKISTGYYSAHAIKTDGTLWAWGRNNAGQSGTGNDVVRSSPVQIGSDTTWSKVSSGYSHTTAIKTDGTLWSWGANGNGQLGQNNTVAKSSPVQVGALTTWLDSVSHVYFTSALKTDGTIWGWGQNTYGNIGDNTQIDRSSPVQIGALTNWSKIAGSGYGNFGIKTDNTLWSWGLSAFGVLGLGDTTYRSSPVQLGSGTWSKVAGNNGFNGLAAQAITTSGTLYSWGRGNTDGALGTGNEINRSSPVQVGALNTWLDISVGYNSTMSFKRP